ncbi:MAG: AraC family transcriptional regulator [Exiguobacterium sp.]|uniref:AraC family transcriptional regulator n=1 Tax=Exiguobacterium alkaliphilum TaxID=1428684 RepID=A0ABT2KTT6_9BACL|nr:MULTISPECIES: AraC family transcriptional regulator [Exiguobacterium]MCT4794377.1 AraC family transcriptional regulator [Exiguobacterium alkaliphilum]MDX5322631.1 AraC family transcriptional regulator [Exiguobacterium sp.]MDX5424369.1 AraC family transcriptional regulator [Exiguobacterium sp.]MDX6771876.1 AraC family transcriptional regulator [Exiguobacterium sp.]
MEIGFCGYSYHTTSYTFPFPNQLETYLIRLQTEGTARVVINGETYAARPGDLLLVRPGDDYALHVDTPASGDYHLFCLGAPLDAWWEEAPRQTMTSIPIDARMLSLWQHITEEARRPAIDQDERIIETLVQALLFMLDRAMHENRMNTRPPVVSRMMRYIESHATDDFKVADVADAVGLSVSRTVHLFKEATGLTIIAYAQSIRLQLAEEQMRYTQHSLEQIAEQSGFHSYPYFHRIFKRKYGVAPGVYRTLQQKNENK